MMSRHIEILAQWFHPAWSVSTTFLKYLWSRLLHHCLSKNLWCYSRNPMNHRSQNSRVVWNGNSYGKYMEKNENLICIIYCQSVFKSDLSCSWEKLNQAHKVVCRENLFFFKLNNPNWNSTWGWSDLRSIQGILSDKMTGVIWWKKTKQTNK